MNVVGQPAWRTEDVIAAQQMTPLCKICGAPGHMWPVDGEGAIAVAAQEFGVSRNELLSHRRFDELVEARAFVVWCLHFLGRPWRYAAIGRLLERDHSSIIHLLQKAIHLQASDDRFRSACNQVEQFFYKTRIHHHG